MNRPLLLSFCSVVLFALKPPVVVAEVVVVEAPTPESKMKLFEFKGGTPGELMAELIKTYGPFGKVVTLEDKTKGPLPAIKLFASSARNLLVGAMREGLELRLQMQDDANWLRLTFLADGDPVSDQPKPVAAVPAEKPAILFHFPGGTPLELVAALDEACGSHLTEITTVAPELATVKLPVLRMRISDAQQVIERLDGLSESSAGAFGDWRLSGRNGDEVKPGIEADVLMIGPEYNDYNPPPAILARDMAGPELRTIRELKKKVGALESKLHSMSGSLETIQKQLSGLSGKAP
jgi:hypothetical protein